MAGFVDSTVKEIDERLRELKEEVAKLEAARSALTRGRRGPGRPPGSTTTRRRRAGRPRSRRGGGTRSNQALELVRARPGITIPEIAAELKIEPNYLYRVMPGLVESGQVRRDGKGWHPAN